MADKIYHSEMEIFVKLANKENFHLGEKIVKEYLKSIEMEELADTMERTCFNFITVENNKLVALFHTHFYSGEIEDILIPIEFCVESYFSHL